MLYVFCALSVLTGFAGIATVGGVLTIMPWDILLEGAARNTLTFLTVAAAGSLLFAMLPISLTAIVAGLIGLRLVWRDEDMKQRRAQQKGPRSTKPAEPDLKPRNAD